MLILSQANSDSQLQQVRQLKRSFLAWQKDTYQDRLDLLEKYFEPQRFEAELASLPGRFAHQMVAFF